MISTNPSLDALAAYTRPVEPCTHPPVTEASFSEQTEERRWDRVLRSLRKLRSLQNNWDGEGSNPPPSPIIEAAIRLVDRLQSSGFSIPTTAVASRAETVLFTWQQGSCYQEIEVVAPDRIEWMMIDERGNSTHGEINLQDGTV